MMVQRTIALRNHRVWQQAGEGKRVVNTRLKKDLKTFPWGMGREGRDPLTSDRQARRGPSPGR